MADRNITEVYLLNVPLENDYRNTIWFPDPATQESYFKDESRVKKVYTEFSYLRKDGIIRVDVDYDSVVSLGCNYVAYRNKAYSNKWFYAFITNIEYKNEGRTDIHIETDVMQTWLFNHTVQQSYIEREHCFNDTPGVNTQPEDLETGEYITNNVVKCKEIELCDIIVASTVNATKTPSIVDEETEKKVYPRDFGYKYNGVYSGPRYYHFGTAEEVQSFINKLDNSGQGEAITAIFLYPSSLIPHHPNSDVEVIQTNNSTAVNWAEGSYETIDGETFYVPPRKDRLVCRAISLQGYTPRNKKLLTFPYCYMMMANNGGNEVNYHYELFEYPDNTALEDQICDFKIYGAIAAGGSIRLVPLKYAGENENYLKGLTAAKYPICSWATDVYTNWLTQNSLNLDIAKERGQLAVQSANLSKSMAELTGYTGLIENALEFDVGGMINHTANTVSAVGQARIARANGLLDIQSVAAQKYQQSLNPPESKGAANAADVTYGAGLSTFTAHQMSIKAEYAAIIDKYFDMYGYATNLVKRPNFYDEDGNRRAYRESYWFTKTIAANVDAAIPNVDLNIIKRCYNNGITFWRHTKTVGDYTQYNGIVK